MFSGFICFVVLCISFLVEPTLKFPWQEKLVITVFFVSAIIALGFSWTFHTVHCHSEAIGKLFNKYVLSLLVDLFEYRLVY